jgi:hypothetical protein
MMTRVRARVVIPVLMAAALAFAPSAQSATTSHRCPAHAYWDDIVVRGMSCHQAAQVHQAKLRDCPEPRRRVTPAAYVYTCSFGPWRSTERVGRHRFFDDIYIRRDAGRIWMRYEALP